MAKNEARPLEIHIPETQPDDLMARLKRTRFPDGFANDNGRYGDNTTHYRELIDDWINTYDRRDVERRMNELPHFKIDLMGAPLHFVHVHGKGRSPMPLLLHHGWPWTLWDLRKVIGPLTDPEAYGGSADGNSDIILISLPDYGFSSPLRATGWNFWRTADLENTLMKSTLGDDKYATAGGDWDALIAQRHGYKY